jgi:hypothetical protein
MDPTMPDFEQDRMFKRWERLHLEQLANHERWRLTGLCDGLDDYQSLEVSYLMENQRLFNENADQPAWFNRLSIPLTRRVFGTSKFIGWQLGSVQVSHGPVAIVKSVHGGKPRYHEIQVVTRMLKSVRLNDNDFHPMLNTTDRSALDQESEKVNELSEKITTEFNQEILKNLYDNASNKTTIGWMPEDGGKEVWPSVGFLRNTVRDRSGVLPNWIVTSPAVGKALRQHVEHKVLDAETGTGVVATAVLDDELTLFENHDATNNDCVVGYKGGSYGSQYLFIPYIPFASTPGWLSKDEFKPQRGILVRYGKKLLAAADNYYGLLKLEAPK